MAINVTRAWSYDIKSAKFDLTAAGDVFTFPARCLDAVSMDVRGTFVGTVILEGSIDGINWTQITAAINPATAGAGTTSFTAPGQAQFYTGGYTTCRVRCSAYTSGTLTVTLERADGFEITQLISTSAIALNTSTSSIGFVQLNSSSATGGIPSVNRLLSSAASVNATSVKATAGRVYRISGQNTNAAARYLKLYNKASAPTVGTDTPVYTRYIPPSAQFDFDFGELGLQFATGIAFAITTVATDADTTALTAGDIVCMNTLYA